MWNVKWYVCILWEDRERKNMCWLWKGLFNKSKNCSWWCAACTVLTYDIVSMMMTEIDSSMSFNAHHHRKQIIIQWEWVVLIWWRWYARILKMKLFYSIKFGYKILIFIMCCDDSRNIKMVDFSCVLADNFVVIILYFILLHFMQMQYIVAYCNKFKRIPLSVF